MRPICCLGLMMPWSGIAPGTYVLGTGLCVALPGRNYRPRSYRPSVPVTVILSKTQRMVELSVDRKSYFSIGIEFFSIGGVGSAKPSIPVAVMSRLVDSSSTSRIEGFIVG
jgi:hypothetical protein